MVYLVCGVYGYVFIWGIFLDEGTKIKMKYLNIENY